MQAGEEAEHRHGETKRAERALLWTVRKKRAQSRSTKRERGFRNLGRKVSERKGSGEASGTRYDRSGAPLRVSCG